MATSTKKKPKVPSALAQAQAEMDVKYKPQLDTAQNLLGEAATQYKSDIETAKNNQQAIDAYAEAKKAPTIDRYKDAQTAQGGFEANSATALQGVGPAGDILSRAITGEQGSLRSRLQGAGTRASQELDDRQTSALAGKIAAQTQARGDYRKTKTGLTSQIQSLIGQQGSDVIARFGQLAEADAERQKDINVAKIGANARRDVATAGAKSKADAAADTAAGKARDKKEKHLEAVHAATGTLKQNVADIADLWQGYAARVQYRPNPDKKTNAAQPYLNADGNPVSEKEHAAKKVMSPQEIKDAIQKDTDYDPGLVHVALLIRAKQPLDAAAINYIKANRNWRIPREWLPKSMTPNPLPDQYGGVGRGADTT
jgi:hypothetical protein